jgi:ribonuclease HI
MWRGLWQDCRFCIFTDGSGFEGGVGAAVAAMKGREMGEQCTKYLGTNSEHTVFEAEVCGAILALDIVTGTPPLTSVDVFMDCQPAITALSSPKTQPGKYLLAAFHALLARLCQV